MFNNRTVTARAKRIQRTLRVTLNIANADDNLVYQVVEWWRKQNRLLPSIRKAVRLLYDLEAGNVDVLLELFPHVGRALAAREVEQKAAALLDRVGQIEDYIVDQEAKRLGSGDE